MCLAVGAPAKPMLQAARLKTFAEDLEDDRDENSSGDG